MDKELQDFLKDEESKPTCKEKADLSRISNAFKACEKAGEVISHAGGSAKGEVESIEKNLEYIVDHDLFEHTTRETHSFWNIFYEVLDQKRGDAILLAGNLDQVNFTLEEARKLLRHMSAWSGSLARRGKDPEKQGHG